jgi:hypothetical protein
MKLLLPLKIILDIFERKANRKELAIAGPVQVVKLSNLMFEVEE